MLSKSSLLVLLVFISQVILAQNYKKAFKALDNKDYTKARIIFTKAQVTDDTKSIGDYGMAIVYQNTSLRIEDMYKAYQSILNAKNNFSQCSEKVKSKNSEYFNLDKITKKVSSIDKRLYDMVKAKNDIKEYERHISDCPNSEFHKQAIILRNKKAFAITTEFNTIPAYEDFISKYPNSKEYTKAITTLYEMAWEECAIYNEKAKYQEFINKYPKATQVITAKRKILLLDYEQAKAVNTDDAFTTFIKNHPNSEEAKELQNKAIINAYQKAKTFKRLDICNNFILNFPNTKYTSFIIQLRDSLAYIDALKINTPEEYRNFISKYPNAMQTPLAMEKMGTLLYSKAELNNIGKKSEIRKLNIKTLKIFRKENDSIKVLEIEKHFDTYGNCTYDFEQIIDGYTKVKKYYYDNTGDKLIKEQHLINNKIKYIIENSYNIKGLKTKSKITCMFNCDDSLKIHYNTLQYDEKRNLINKTTTTENNDTISKHTYKYDTKGNQINENYIEIKDNSYKEFMVIMNYNGNDNLIQKIIKPIDEKAKSIESYSYDGLGKIISSSKYDASGTLLRTYFYNSKGLHNTETIKYESSSKPAIIRVWEYEFR